jgi:D-sedoheptulose 7-phosphate isomerase
MTELRKKFMKRYLEEVRACLSTMEGQLDTFDEMGQQLLDARERGATIFLCGNGGSASCASHFTSDLAKGTIHPKEQRFRVISLSDNIPLMTAWGNDSSYDDIFVEQLKNLMKPGDVVIGISGSGNSPNVLKTIKWARKNGAKTVSITGFKGGKMASVAERSYVIPLHYMQQIEDLHMLIEHMVTSAIREEFHAKHGTDSKGC